MLIGLLVWVVVAVYEVGLWSGLFLYPSARLYILVGAFAGLRILPVGAYDTVVWASMWPHFS